MKDLRRSLLLLLFVGGFLAAMFVMTRLHNLPSRAAAEKPMSQLPAQAVRGTRGQQQPPPS